MNQSETSVTSFGDKELETHLKDLLERILLQMEKYIETKEDLNNVEAELKDYENLTCLVGIIKVIFTNLISKIDKKLQKLERQLDPSKSTKSLRGEEEYEKLEQTVQKYEGEIRNHIRLEQQLKLYAESIQAKLDESEQTRSELLDTTKNIINNLKRENQKMNEQIQRLESENTKMQQKIDQMETEAQKKTIESDKVDYHISLLTKQSQQIKGLVQRKPQQYNKSTNSYSEHKLSSHADAIYQQESTDYPTQSQGSLKQNYFNILQYGQQQQQQQQQYQQSQQQSAYQQQIDTLKSLQLNDASKIYGQMLRNKHNSISTIKDIAQNKKQSHQIISYTASKNTSQNNSLHHKHKGDISATIQVRSRSNSSRRPYQPGLSQKQKTTMK